MADLPLLIGPQIVFEPSWASGNLIIPGDAIVEYKKTLYSPSLPTFEIGPLGQLSQRQQNSATVPYLFQWTFVLNEIDKGNLEGIVANQTNRYAQNNERTNVDIFYSDERLATLELEGFARPVRVPENLFDTNPTTFSFWQFSQFRIKFQSFSTQRLDSDFWQIQCQAIESALFLN